MATMTKALAVGHTGMAVEATGTREDVARNILLFLAAPWIGLAYLIAFPFVGCAALLKALLAR